MPAWALPPKKVSETSFAFGAAGEEEPTRRPKGPFPPLPPSPLPLFLPFHSGQLPTRHALRWLVCVASPSLACFPPSLPRCTFSLFLGAMKTPGGRASEVGFVAIVVGCDANINVLQIASLAACTDTRRPCPLILRVHCVPPFLPS